MCFLSMYLFRTVLALSPTKTWRARGCSSQIPWFISQANLSWARTLGLQNGFSKRTAKSLPQHPPKSQNLSDGDSVRTFILTKQLIKSSNICLPSPQESDNILQNKYWNQPGRKLRNLSRTKWVQIQLTGFELNFPCRWISPTLRRNFNHSK